LITKVVQSYIQCVSTQSSSLDALTISPVDLREQTNRCVWVRGGEVCVGAFAQDADGCGGGCVGPYTCRGPMRGWRDTPSVSLSCWWHDVPSVSLSCWWREVPSVSLSCWWHDMPSVSLSCWWRDVPSVSLSCWWRDVPSVSLSCWWRDVPPVSLDIGPSTRASRRQSRSAALYR